MQPDINKNYRTNTLISTIMKRTCCFTTPKGSENNSSNMKFHTTLNKKIIIV